MAAPVRPPRVQRSNDHRVLGGVAAGLARWLGIDPLVVRLGFVVLTMSGGIGALVYAVLWVALPDEEGSQARLSMPAISAIPADRWRQGLALLLLLVGSLLLLREAGLWLGDRIVWPFVVAAVGVVLIWPRPGASAEGDITAGIESRRTALRIGGGVFLMAVGASTFVAAGDRLQALGDALLAALVTAAGLGLVLGPWAVRLARQAKEERGERIRSQERAELAARVHDSVLQTLTLIQQHAGDAVETARLARRQERELRAWLYEDPATSAGGVRAAAAEAAAEVEDLFGVTVQTVVVGDRPMDERLEALVNAAKEAMVNAAKFSGQGSVSLYVEVEPAAVTAYVRDRGPGFDVEAVPPDRHGITDSIQGRMERHGGTALVRSAPGQGTEVELMLPVDGAAP